MTGFHRPLQLRVNDWMLVCFDPEITSDKIERGHRFLEEALELAQANGMTREQVIRLVEYTYARPIGELGQEVGGVMLTLAALCNAHRLDMNALAEAELTRVWEMIEKIREKQAGKVKGDVLPEAGAKPTSTGLRDRAERFLALAEKATPGPWQTRFLYRLFTRVRMSPGDLEFNTKPQADWPDCEFIEAARNDAPDLIRALLASPAPAGAEGLQPMPEDDVLRARLLIDIEIVKRALLEAADKFTVFFYNFKDGSPEKEVCESNRKLMRDALESFRRLSAPPASPAPSPATPPAEAREVVERVRATREKLVDYACHFGARDDVSKLFIAAALDHAEAVSVMLAALPAAEAREIVESAWRSFDSLPSAGVIECRTSNGEYQWRWPPASAKTAEEI